MMNERDIPKFGYHSGEGKGHGQAFLLGSLSGSFS